MAPIKKIRSERGDAILRKADYFAGIPLAFVGAIYRKLASFTPPDDIREIGLFCPGAIGDLVLLSALIDGLLKKLPGARAELIVTKSNADCAELIPGVSARAFDIRRPARIIAHMASKKYDLLFDACQWARIGAIVSAFSGARRTIGFVTKGQARGWGYDYPVIHRDDRHEIENFLALGRALWPELNGQPRLSIKAAGDGEKIIVCHAFPAPGRGRPLKLWPGDNWAEFVRMALEAGYDAALTGSGEDAETAEKFILKYFPREKRVYSVAGKWSFAELARNLTRSSGLVSVNTGIMHLGAALGIPVIGLHGPTNPLRWGPVGPKTAALLPDRGRNAYLNLGFEYPRGAKNNMAGIRPGVVFATLLRLIAAN